MIRIRHGAGDRATGLDNSNKAFDLILTSGQKMQERLMSDQNIAKEKLPIIGYPKFDMIDKLPPPRPLFNNNKKTVLYNPHFRRDESSWVKMGMDVLHFFKDNKDYNLIFAPHILLYQRALRHGAKNLHAFKNCPNIHIDTGSDALIDMTYTRQADIYLGDVSSQIYEFLRQPRPCLFLNAHHIHDWQNKQTFKHWQCGDVCESIDDLEHALTQIDTWKNRYLHTQKQLLDDTFSQKGTASRNAARAIVNYLEITQG
jgi:CDP-glycerol glycerophosphotransferase (TagB/SpsB family)